MFWAHRIKKPGHKCCHWDLLWFSQGFWRLRYSTSASPPVYTLSMQALNASADHKILYITGTLPPLDKQLQDGWMVWSLQGVWVCQPLSDHRRTGVMTSADLWKQNPTSWGNHLQRPPLPIPAVVFLTFLQLSFIHRGRPRANADRLKKWGRVLLCCLFCIKHIELTMLNKYTTNGGDVHPFYFVLLVLLFLVLLASVFGNVS